MAQLVTKDGPTDPARFIRLLLES